MELHYTSVHVYIKQYDYLKYSMYSEEKVRHTLQMLQQTESVQSFKIFLDNLNEALALYSMSKHSKWVVK
jgi:predicted GH43/DUF377 family glycosyl hydrolase